MNNLHIEWECNTKPLKTKNGLYYSPLDTYKLLRKKNKKLDNLVKEFNLDLTL